MFWIKHLLFYFLHLQVTKKSFLSFRPQILLTCLYTTVCDFKQCSGRNFLPPLFSLVCLGFAFNTINNSVLTSQIIWQREMRFILCSSQVNFCKYLVSSETFPYSKYTSIRAMLKVEYIAQNVKMKLTVCLNWYLWGNKVQHHKLQTDSGYILNLVGDMPSAEKYSRACMKALEGARLRKTES